MGFIYGLPAQGGGGGAGGVVEVEDVEPSSDSGWSAAPIIKEKEHDADDTFPFFGIAFITEALIRADRDKQQASRNAAAAAAVAVVKHILLALRRAPGLASSRKSRNSAPHIRRCDDYGDDCCSNGVDCS